MSDLQEIKGIGNTVQEKLEEIGINTTNQLANSSVDELESAGIRRPETILDRAQKQGVQIQKGEDIEKEQANTRRIPSGIDAFDEMLDGGFEGGFLIGVSGEHKAGKTQFALQSLASAADNTDDSAVYIETEPNRYQIDRIKMLTREKESYKQIHKIEAYSPNEETDNLALQRNSYDVVRENFDSVSMVVVDSFVANFRLSGNFSGRSTLPERNAEIAKHMNKLQALSNDLNCPILCTLQVMGDPDMYSGQDIVVWGSNHMGHVLSYMIHLSRGKGELRELNLKGHPAIPDGSIALKIPEDAPIESG